MGVPNHTLLIIVVYNYGKRTKEQLHTSIQTMSELLRSLIFV